MNKSVPFLWILFFGLFTVQGISQSKKDLLLHQWNHNKYETLDDRFAEQIDISLAVWFEDKLAADSLMDITLSHPKILDYPDRYVTAIWIKNNRTPRTEAKLVRYQKIDSIACALDVSPYVKVDIKHFWARILFAMKYYEQSVYIYEEAVDIASDFNLPKLSLLRSLLSKSRTEYEIEQEAKIVLLKKDQKIKLYNEKIKGYKISGLLGLLLLALGLFTMFQLKKRNTQIQKQNEIISKALSEKDLLLREIHHRVNNNLQLVSSLLTLQERSIDDKKAIKAITEGRSRVRSMALIHQDLYNKENLTAISVSEYLEKLTQELFSTYGVDTNRISLQMDIQALNLHVDTLIPLGLIINELVTNSLKYGFPNDRIGQLNISLKEEHEKLILKVADDGVGYDPNMVRENSFGSTLISALTEQLDGQMKIDGTEGTTVTITMRDYINH